MEYLTFGSRRRQRERREEGGRFATRGHRGEWAERGCQETAPPDPADLELQGDEIWSVGDEWLKLLVGDLKMISA